eukprot:173417-Rhodomonas_salina.1
MCLSIEPLHFPCEVCTSCVQGPGPVGTQHKSGSLRGSGSLHSCQCLPGRAAGGPGPSTVTVPVTSGARVHRVLVNHDGERNAGTGKHTSSSSDDHHHDVQVSGVRLPPPGGFSGLSFLKDFIRFILCNCHP